METTQETKKGSALAKVEKSLFVFFIFHALFNAAISITTDGAYNTYYPIILQGGNPGFASSQGVAQIGFGLSAFLTGIVMSLDNLIGILFVPIFGAMGDKSLKRKEYLVIYGYLFAGLFALIPVIANTVTPENSGKTEKLILPLMSTILVAILVAVTSRFSGAYRNGYIFSKVPNARQGTLQSFAVIAGAVGYIIATSVSSYLYTINRAYPFFLGSLILAIVTLLFQLIAPPETEKNAKIMAEIATRGKKKFNPLETIKEVFFLLSKDDKISMLMIVLVQNLGKFGVVGLQTFFSSWMLNKLGLGPNISAMSTVIFFAAFLVASFPMGVLVDKVDKIKLYLVGIAIMVFCGIAMVFLGTNLLMVNIISVVLGIGLSIFDILTIPYAMSFVPEGSNASGTIISIIIVILGIFAVVIVPLCGFLIDITKDYNTLFYSMTAAALLALIPLYVIYRVKKNEMKSTVSTES